MRILVVAQDLPFPPLSGGQLRTYHLVRTLATHHDLTLVGFTCGEDYTPPPFPIRVVDVPWEWPRLYQEMSSADPCTSRLAWEILASPTHEPWLVSCFESPRMEQTLREVARDTFDLILIEHTYMARFLPVLPPRIPKILDVIDVQSLVAMRAVDRALEHDKEAAAVDADRMLRFERDVASQCNLCLTVSGREAAAARRLLGIDHVDVVPNGVDTSFFAPANASPDRDSLLFTGLMNYAPNVEAVQYFAHEIHPLIRRDRPEAKLHVVGNKPTDSVKALSSASVVVHGRVPDMRPYFQRATVVVVPLLHGGGTRLKILEAAASGKAIVTTSLGVEGLDFCSGQELVVADTPAAFADAVLRLLDDEAGRRHLGEGARTASLRYDWDVIGTGVRQLVEALA
jgi:polysaccharide biosynthesis protein PslH